MTRQSSIRRGSALVTAAALAVISCSQPAAVEPAVAGPAALVADTTSRDAVLACGAATQVSVSLTASDIQQSTQVDLMFVLDDSSSITNAQFETLRQQLVDLVQGATELFAHGGSIGVLLFSGTSQIWPGTAIPHGLARLQLAPSTDPDAVVAALRAMSHLSGATCTSCGLDLATQQLEQGAAGRKRVAIVITDGASNALGVAPAPGSSYAAVQSALEAAVERAHAADIELFAVGVGPLVNSAELLLIADDPDAQHEFETSGFSMLESALGSITQAVALPEATQAVLTLTVNSDFTVGGAQADTGSVRVTGQQLVWSLDALRDQTATLTYDITHRPESLGGSKPIHSAVDYRDAEGNSLDVPPLTISVSGCDHDGDGIPDETDTSPTPGEHCPSQEEVVPGVQRCTLQRLVCECETESVSHHLYSNHAGCAAFVTHELVHSASARPQDARRLWFAAVVTRCELRPGHIQRREIERDW